MAGFTSGKEHFFRVREGWRYFLGEAREISIDWASDMTGHSESDEVPSCSSSSESTGAVKKKKKWTLGESFCDPCFLMLYWAYSLPMNSEVEDTSLDKQEEVDASKGRYGGFWGQQLGLGAALMASVVGPRGMTLPWLSVYWLPPQTPFPLHLWTAMAQTTEW